MNWRAFCIRGAFLGRLALEDDIEGAGGGRTDPVLSTLGAVARAATRAAGLAEDACAVPCNACNKRPIVNYHRLAQSPAFSKHFY